MGGHIYKIQINLRVYKFHYVSFFIMKYFCSCIVFIVSVSLPGCWSKQALQVNNKPYSVILNLEELEYCQEKIDNYLEHHQFECSDGYTKVPSNTISCQFILA